MSKTDSTAPRCTEKQMVGRCGSCRFFLVQDEPWRRDVYQFIERLSEQEGRHVALGYCVRIDATGEGPRADADSCKHYQSANISHERPAESGTLNGVVRKGG